MGETADAINAAAWANVECEKLQGTITKVCPRCNAWTVTLTDYDDETIREHDHKLTPEESVKLIGRTVEFELHPSPYPGLCYPTNIWVQD